MRHVPAPTIGRLRGGRLHGPARVVPPRTRRPAAGAAPLAAALRKLPTALDAIAGPGRPWDESLRPP